MVLHLHLQVSRKKCTRRVGRKWKNEGSVLLAPSFPYLSLTVRGQHKVLRGCPYVLKSKTGKLSKKKLRKSPTPYRPFNPAHEGSVQRSGPSPPKRYVPWSFLRLSALRFSALCASQRFALLSALRFEVPQGLRSPTGTEKGGRTKGQHTFCASRNGARAKAKDRD